MLGKSGKLWLLQFVIVRNIFKLNSHRQLCVFVVVISTKRFYVIIANVRNSPVILNGSLLKFQLQNSRKIKKFYFNFDRALIDNNTFCTDKVLILYKHLLLLLL